MKTVDSNGIRRWRVFGRSLLSSSGFEAADSMLLGSSSNIPGRHCCREEDHEVGLDQEVLRSRRHPTVVHLLPNSTPYRATHPNREVDGELGRDLTQPLDLRPPWRVWWPAVSPGGHRSTARPVIGNLLGLLVEPAGRVSEGGCKVEEKI